nr:partner of Y14 and mago [Tanacetum cinerariifolium]
MLAKFIDEGKYEHEEMEIFVKYFRTTNELLLKEGSHLLSELEIKIWLTEAQQEKAGNDLKPKQLEKVAKLDDWRKERKLLEEKRASLDAL